MLAAFRFHGLQLLWLFGIFIAVRHRQRLGPQHGLAVALPAAFLIVHIFVQVYIYYPRHIIMGHLSMAVVGFVLVRTLTGASVTPAGGPVEMGDLPIVDEGRRRA